MITSSVARQQLGKHVSAKTDTHATVEELLESVFSVWSIMRLCNEHEQDKLVEIQQLE
jgi:hypothetical protein